MTLSRQNTTLPGSNADLHPRDVGPEGRTAGTAMDAVNLSEAMAENRSRLTVRAALVAGLMGHLDLCDHPERDCSPMED